MEKGEKETPLLNGSGGKKVSRAAQQRLGTRRTPRPASPLRLTLPSGCDEKEVASRLFPLGYTRAVGRGNKQNRRSQTESQGEEVPRRRCEERPGGGKDKGRGGGWCFFIGSHASAVSLFFLFPPFPFANDVLRSRTYLLCLS